ncbi:MAG: hypothetical protein AB8E15_04835 [Bdellovibrionales bacterium]
MKNVFVIFLALFSGQVYAKTSNIELEMPTHQSCPAQIPESYAEIIKEEKLPSYREFYQETLDSMARELNITLMETPDFDDLFYFKERYGWQLLYTGTGNPNKIASLRVELVPLNPDVDRFGISQPGKSFAIEAVDNFDNSIISLKIKMSYAVNGRYGLWTSAYTKKEGGNKKFDRLGRPVNVPTNFVCTFQYSSSNWEFWYFKVHNAETNRNVYNRRINL